MYQVCCNSMLIDLNLASQVGFICVIGTNLDVTVIKTITIIRFIYSNERKFSRCLFKSENSKGL